MIVILIAKSYKNNKQEIFQFQDEDLKLGKYFEYNLELYLGVYSYDISMKLILLIQPYQETSVV